MGWGEWRSLIVGQRRAKFWSEKQPWKRTVGKTRSGRGLRSHDGGDAAEELSRRRSALTSVALRAPSVSAKGKDHNQTGHFTCYKDRTF